MENGLREDLAYAQALVDSNVLVKIRRDILPISNGVIVVCCGDGDQFCDRIDYLRRLLRDLGCPERPHFITRHGGALRLVENSPLNTPSRGTDLDLLDEIEEAMDLKKIYTILLEGHCKCGKCYKHGLDFRQVTEGLVQAKKRIDSRFQNAIPVKVCHIDWGNGQKHYFKLCGSRLSYWQLKSRFPDRVTALPAQGF